MITMYRAFLVFMGAVSAYMIPEAMGLPKDSQYTIGPGFLPSIMLGAVLVGCVLLLILDLRHKDTSSIEKSAYGRLGLYLMATVLLILAMEYIGIILSVIVYIFCVIFVIEKNGLASALKVSLVTGIGIYLIFHTWLQVPMTICNFF